MVLYSKLVMYENGEIVTMKDYNADGTPRWVKPELIWLSFAHNCNSKRGKLSSEHLDVRLTTSKK